MSALSRHNERRASAFSEVRQRARDDLLMVVAGGTGVVAVASAIVVVVLATVS